MQPCNDNQRYPPQNGRVETACGPKHARHIQASDIQQVACDTLNLAAEFAQNAISRKVAKKMENFVDRKVRLFEGLEKILPPLIPGVARGPKRLRDAEYIKIREWCESNGFVEWGKRPRTLVVLYMLGQPEVLDEFISDNRSDIALPYTEENLPRAIKGPKRAEFLDYQQHVLTTHAADLESPGRPHQTIDGNADSLFWVEKDLGSGGFGVVDHVFGRLSLNAFARKRIPRGRSFKKDREAIQNFENELENLKQLSHRHLVRLVGSYTDRKYVGLIMTPVADMDLETYLATPNVDPVTRVNSLRRFYGCMATAVEYLHQHKMRHNDIKPKNILVKDHQVLLTDLNTSHSWANDTRSTTSGTNKNAYTRAYCAPEVIVHGPRSSLVDIWSLGCVFLEMRTVLSGFTVRDMRRYFQENGTGGQYVRNNPAATESWMNELSTQATCDEDNQILDLVRSMCSPKACNRPTATQVVSEILDFDGTYFNFCCDRNDTHWSEGQTDTATTDDADTKTRKAEICAVQREVCTDLVVQEIARSSNYEHPSVEEVDDDMTLLYHIPDENQQRNGVVDSALGYNEAAQTSSRDESIQPESEHAQQVEQPTTDVGSEHLSTGTDMLKPWLRTGTDTIQCLWPNCSYQYNNIVEGTQPMDLLRLHLRSQHLTHELGWSSFIREEHSDSDGTDSDKTLLNSHSEKDHSLEKRFVLLNVTTAAEPAPEPDKCTVGKQRTASQTRSCFNSGEAKFESQSASKQVRFSMLPEDCRPEPKDLDDNIQFSRQNMEISEGLLTSQHTKYLWRLSGNGDTGVVEAKQNERLPGSSLVPSFFLASTNLFSAREINFLLPSGRFSNLRTPPLFVCGSLMFPSILKAQAERFISAEGTYSKTLQRRLRTDSKDWAKINNSLQDAAESMTPALLRAASIYKVKGLSSSILRREPRISGADQLNSNVVGFLLFGLSEEALSCLDHLFSRESEAPITEKASQGWPVGLSFSREKVQAEIKLKEGGTATVDAVAYFGVDNEYGRKEYNWDIRQFTETRAFRKLSAGIKGDSGWVSEEEKFANTMGIKFVLPGDALRDACMSGDRERVLSLLEEGQDINAPCSIYGSCLQAAAFAGSEVIVELLIRKGADVNKQGGHYQSALIAATLQGHEEVARVLLKEKADVLGRGGRYISAIYQAVDFSDLRLAHILLEKGAWLTPNYGELLDLATEHGNRNMLHLLEDYDAKMIHRKALEPAKDKYDRLDNSDSLGNTSGRPYRDTFSTTGDDRNTMTRTSQSREITSTTRINGAILKAACLQIIILKGSRGKWTGIKGVKVMRAAINAGMPEEIVDKARPHLGMANNALEWLKTAVEDLNKNDAHDLRKAAALAALNGPLGQLQQDRGPQPAITRSSSGHDERSNPRRSLNPEFPPFNSPYPNTESNVAPLSKVACSTCDGRGGRRGTELRCNRCSGTGRRPRRTSTSRPSRRSRDDTTRCDECRGTGYIYSRRDRCRACQGTGPENLAPRRETIRIGAENISQEPPPPYSIY